MKIGYARVSTEEQNLDMQLLALSKYGCDVVFSDQGISGTRFDRPGLLDALTAATSGHVLVVWRLDRLGRSLQHLIKLINDLGDNGVQFVSLTENIDTCSPTGRFTFHMIAALAEFERSLISERTRAGIHSAKNRGRRIGRPGSLTSSQRDEARRLLQENSEAVVAKILNVHPKTLRRHLRAHDRDIENILNIQIEGE
ncbi:recombinase family protein [Burkholderia pyrrocinia]